MGQKKHQFCQMSRLIPDDGERLDLGEEGVGLLAALLVRLDAARRARVGRHQVREEPRRLAVVVHLGTTIVVKIMSSPC